MGTIVCIHVVRVEKSASTGYITIMSKKIKRWVGGARNRGKLGNAVRIEGKKTTPDGKEVWLISSEGKTFNLTTSISSTAIMDDAVRIYAPALKRLANR